MLLRYEYFCTYAPILYSRIMGCHGNHGISKTKEHLFLKTTFFALNEMSFVFNFRSDYPVAYYSLATFFPSFLRFH